MTAAPVSVVIPAYQSEALIADAIETVLAQTVEPEEIVVVDDGSTDGTVAIIEGYVERTGARVRLVKKQHAGTGAARNVGLAASTQPFVALLDADDLWHPTKLERQLPILDDPEVGAVFCWAQNSVGGVPSGPSMPAPLPSAMLLRREVATAVGPFDESGLAAEWADWYLRMVDLGVRTSTVEELLVQRRIHGANKGITERSEVTVYARVLKASLDRRRARTETP